MVSTLFAIPTEIFIADRLKCRKNFKYGLHFFHNFFLSIFVFNLCIRYSFFSSVQVLLWIIQWAFIEDNNVRRLPEFWIKNKFKLHILDAYANFPWFQFLCDALSWTIFPNLIAVIRVYSRVNEIHPQQMFCSCNWTKQSMLNMSSFNAMQSSNHVLDFILQLCDVVINVSLLFISISF